MSPELQEAIEDAEKQVPLNSPVYDQRGIFAAGPQFVNPSDVLAKLIREAKGKLTDEHFAPSPDAQRKQLVVYESRRPPESRSPRLLMPLFSRSEAQRQREAAIR